MIYTLLSIVAVMVVGLNIFATLLVARSHRYEPNQKWSQLALIWFVPILGAVLAWSLAKDSPTERVTTNLTDGGSGSGDGYHNTSAADVGGGDGGGGGGGGGGGD